jgi:hypothetical protein
MQSKDEAINSVLASYPGPVTLAVSRKKWLLLVAIDCIFIIGGIRLIRAGDPSGWPTVIMFAIFGIISALMLLPGTAGLTLEADGFQTANVFGKQRWRWQDVSGFKATWMPWMVAFNDTNSHGGARAKLSTMLIGRDGALSDNYGLRTKDLAQIMTQWRERAIRP